MNSKKAYQILKGQNTFVNFPLAQLKIGDVLEMDERNHRKVLNVFSLITGEGILDKVEKGPKSEYEFISENTFNLEFSNQQNSSPILGHEAGISFKKAKSVYCKLDNLQHTALPLGYIEDELVKIWESKGYDKAGSRKHFHFVSEVYQSNSGLILYSTSANTQAKISSKSKVPLLEESDFLKSELDIQTSSKKLLKLYVQEAFVPFYRTLRMYGKGRFGYF